MKIHLLIIDPQKDFVEKTGSLFVGGATDDMDRLAVMVDKHKKQIDEINCTMDSHRTLHVASPILWKDSKGDHPAPFTVITYKDVVDGVWSASKPSLQRKLEEYVKALEATGKYNLCIWPPHCLIGSEGWTVNNGLFRAFSAWETDQFGIVNYVTKGSNIYTEHYGALKAEVEDPKDPSTSINIGLVQSLMAADLIGIAGEALSHCLLTTVTQVADAFGNDNYIKKMVLLEDCSSAIPGFETQVADFLKNMKTRGMQVSDSKHFLS